MTQSVLLIDLNDSFTYNIAEIIRLTDKAKLRIESVKSCTSRLALNFDKIIISPGPGIPGQYPVLFELMARLESTKPILGICLGHQFLCEYFGAKLINLNDVRHGQKLFVELCGDSILFQKIPERFEAGLYHSWVVSSEDLPGCLVVTSRSLNPDLIMSVQHSNSRIFGVQFHPESFLTQYGYQIIDNFLSI